MEGSSPNEIPQSGPHGEAIASATKFLRTLFAEDNCVLFRPIESWVENGRKRSRVDFKNTRYGRPESPALEHVLRQQLVLAAEEKLNLYFGVCPRFGAGGRFDLAWQIRTVRTLWADVDHVTVADVLERIAKANLPQPSIVVNSGNGAHLYWILDDPYLIDDVGPPSAVETEWIKTAGDKNHPRKYVVENEERVYLDQRRSIAVLSPKAEHLQDVLAGIAKAIGGDHTTDLSRLLRIPGSLNRKDQRNGREPIPTELVTCDPDLRYPLVAFEPFKSPSPETLKRTKIAAMPLPAVRKISPSKSDALAEKIAKSSLVEAGLRSEADFATCCYAVRNGIDKEHVWSRVESIGKFAESGRRYFDVTWENAEYEVRSGTYQKLSPQAQPADVMATPQPSDEDAESGDAQSTGRRPTILVNAAETPVADTLKQITDRLLSTGECFSRADQLVVIHKQEIAAILSSPELAGLLNQHVEFYFLDDDRGQYKPLPPAYANTWLNHRVERARLPAITSFVRNPVYSEDWRLVAPGFDSQSGIFYAGSAIEPRQGTEHLDALLQEFCFKTAGDRTNYIAMLLTTVLIPRFIGSKPAALFCANQAGLGKTILAQTISAVRDGTSAETVSYNPNDEEFEKRLGAVVRRGATTIIIDNAKSSGRNPRIESACLERSITDPVLSFRLLGQSNTIRAENSHIFCLTANSPEVSRDLVTRSVIVNLEYEGDPGRRNFAIEDPEGYALQHRQEVLGELLGLVERWKAAGMPMAKTHSRFNKRGWGNIVGGILQVAGEPDFLANADEAAAQLDEIKRDFTELVAVMAGHPQGTWTAAELVELCESHSLLKNDLGEGSPRSRTTKLGGLAGRFVDERFPLDEGQAATFCRAAGRKGNVYRVSVQESAEP